MTLSPSDMADVKERAAEIIAAKAIEAAGGAAALVVMPMATISQMTGLTRHTVTQTMEVTEISPGKHGVTLKNYQAHLEKNTKGPGLKKQKPGAATPGS